MPLSMVRSGERVRITAINAGRGMQARLAAMGLFPGVELTVVSGHSRGPYVVVVKDTRLVLGRGMTRKIEVTA